MKRNEKNLLLATSFALLILGNPLSGIVLANSKTSKSNPNQPIEIDADQGIEWLAEDKVYLARGNANAKQGDFSMRADILKAFYRNTKSKKDEIYRIEANGQVVIRNLVQNVFGEHGIYDLDRSLIVVSGKNLRLDTGKEIVRAEEGLEFWQKSKLAVARGNASATRKDRRIRANLLTVQFIEDINGKLTAKQIDAQGGVLITTPSEVIVGNEGVYNVIEELVTLSGNVKITRGENQLNGSMAEVNLQSGVSRLISDKSLGGTKKVRGLFIPEKKPAQ